jgi:ribosomal protein S20
MKTHAKYLVREITALIKEGNKKEAQEMAKLLQQTVTKAAKTHVLHANKAARQISGAHKAISKLK